MVDGLLSWYSYSISLQIEYRRNLDNLTVNAEGRPFQMLVFRGSPKSSRKLSSVIDEMRRSDEEIPTNRPLRQFPKVI